jgi:hypothetical protein
MWTLVNASYGIAMGQRPEVGVERGRGKQRGIVDPRYGCGPSGRVRLDSMSPGESPTITARSGRSLLSSLAVAFGVILNRASVTLTWCRTAMRS